MPIFHVSGVNSNQGKESLDTSIQFMEWDTGLIMNNIFTKSFQSIYFRIIAVVIGVVAVVIATVSITTSISVNREVDNFRQVSERARMIRLRQLFNDLIEKENLEDIQTTIDTVRALYGWQILINDREGRLADLSGERELFLPVQRLSILSEGRTLGVIEYGDIGDTTTISQPQWSQISSNVNSWLIWCGLVAGIVGIVSVSFILRKTLHPVKDLTSAAKRLGEGDLSVRVPESGNNEIGFLGNTFNEMARRLEDAETQRRNLMADVAHELRTPLFNIQGRLEAINDGVFEPDVDTINTIYHQVKHLTELVEDVRTLALAESRTLKLDIHLHSMEEVLKHCVDSFRSQAEMREISLTMFMDHDIPEILIDRTRISQVIGNLLQNAISYTSPGGEIAVTLKKTEEKRISISVKDTGPSISEESLPFVFDRFYRSNQVTNTEGSGLGLAIAKELVEAHRGTIYAKNNVDTGSNFVFFLPIE